MELLTTNQLSEMLGITRWTLYSWIRKGTFPAPIQIGSSRTKRWILEDVENYLKSKSISSQPIPEAGSFSAQADHPADML